MGERWIVRAIKEVIAQADPPPAAPPIDTPRQRMLDAEALMDARQARLDDRADARAIAVMAATIYAASRIRSKNDSVEEAAYILRRAREVPSE